VKTTDDTTIQEIESRHQKKSKEQHALMTPRLPLKPNLNFIDKFT
jgi:hypothetical protein